MKVVSFQLMAQALWALSGGEWLSCALRGALDKLSAAPCPGNVSILQLTKGKEKGNFLKFFSMERFWMKCINSHAHATSRFISSIDWCGNSCFPSFIDWERKSHQERTKFCRRDPTCSSSYLGFKYNRKHFWDHKWVVSLKIMARWLKCLFHKVSQRTAIFFTQEMFSIK